MTRALLKQLVDALETAAVIFYDEGNYEMAKNERDLAAALRAELAKPEQEPVAWAMPGNSSFISDRTKMTHASPSIYDEYSIPLYASPTIPAGMQLTLNYAQIIQLVAMYVDDEDCEMTLHQGPGHSGDGIYASHAEYPEEGSVLLDPNEKVASDLSKAIPAGMVLMPERRRSLRRVDASRRAFLGGVQSSTERRTAKEKL